jgi:hypothetical protein
VLPLDVFIGRFKRKSLIRVRQYQWRLRNQLIVFLFEESRMYLYTMAGEKLQLIGVNNHFKHSDESD